MPEETTSEKLSRASSLSTRRARVRLSTGRGAPLLCARQLGHRHLPSVISLAEIRAIIPQGQGIAFKACRGEGGNELEGLQALRDRLLSG